MRRASVLHFCSLLGTLLLSSCFGADGLRSDGSCATGLSFVYGKWKLVKGYPASFKYSANPTQEQIKHDFRALIVEPGGNMCMSEAKNRGLIDPPLYRMKYDGNISLKSLEIDVFARDEVSVSPWQREVATYTMTGCNSANPTLRLTYSNGREEVYQTYSRNVKGGDCGNPGTPPGKPVD